MEMKKNKVQVLKGADVTLVCFLLDESGSMSSCLEPTIQGYNTYIKQMKDAPRINEVMFSLTKFEGCNVVKVHDCSAMDDVVDLNTATYRPAGMTPLFDAIGKTIKAVDVKITELKKSKKTVSVMFIILTDGEENSSTEFRRDDITALIKQRETEEWSFAYMGADKSVWSVASGFGIAAGNIMQYSTANMKQSFCAVAGATLNYRQSGVRSTKDFFANTDVSEKIDKTKKK